MRGEILDIAAWTAALLCHVIAADHLRRHLNIIIASQSVLMAIGALAAAAVANAGGGLALALVAAGATAAVVALLHTPALAALGYELLLVATVALHFIFAEGWLAASSWTGGSGGWFVEPARSAAVVVLAITVAALVAASLVTSRSAFRFAWLTTKSLGQNGGIMGVPSSRLTSFSFAAVGITAGTCGAAIVFLLGYLSIASFPLVWPLVALSIALVARAIPLQVCLSLVYATIHVLLRTRTVPSSFVAPAWEVAFPLILLVLVLFRGLGDKRAARGDHAVDLKGVNT
jgi:hypothetical protein